MASSFNMRLLLCCLFYSIISPTSSKTPSFRPKALVLPVTKDAYTNQYLTQINQRTPLVPVKLTIDLGGELFWVDCENGYISSTYKPARCLSAQCNLARSKSCGECLKLEAKPGCNNNTCTLFPYNPLIHTSASGELAQDIIAIQSTNGLNPGKVVSVPNVIFTCSETFLLENLASGVTGIAGLGRKKIALPSQFASAFSFKRKFSLCLSSSTRYNGVVIFGDEPRDLLPYTGLIYTPLILNPISTTGAYFNGEPSADYFIGLKSIKIDNKAVPFNTLLLSIDEDGTGGTKISTVHPYTSLETSIYKAVVSAFAEALPEVPKVKAVSPFGVCFDANKIGSTRVGPAVPHIDFVLQNEIVWRVYGSNSMVRVSNDVLCLGFVDGGPLHFVEWGVKYTATAVVIGGHQIENNLLQFDLAASKLGFSSSLLLRQTSCSNFNFTPIA
ncbi:probable aspartic proteinase GIP2 [Humulus lupulus]|uniref:probable aspartic proteinase GIP2 n=1 Tax=Humulus lupulus TaxID=3486 RepID=UPI002B400730|nr:probable aspartic proteinase GIP2 [Humulus lupulus]